MLIYDLLWQEWQQRGVLNQRCDGRDTALEMTVCLHSLDIPLCVVRFIRCVHEIGFVFYAITGIPSDRAVFPSSSTPRLHTFIFACSCLYSLACTKKLSKSLSPFAYAPTASVSVKSSLFVRLLTLFLHSPCALWGAFALLFWVGYPNVCCAVLWKMCKSDGMRDTSTSPPKQTAALPYMASLPLLCEGQVKRLLYAHIKIHIIL